MNKTIRQIQSYYAMKAAEQEAYIVLLESQIRLIGKRPVGRCASAEVVQGILDRAEYDRLNRQREARHAAIVQEMLDERTAQLAALQAEVYKLRKSRGEG